MTGKSRNTDFMKSIFRNISNRFTAIALGGALVLAGSAVAFRQKPKAEKLNAPPMDEKPIRREARSHHNLRPVVKKVAPRDGKRVTSTKIQHTRFNGGT